MPQGSDSSAISLESFVASALNEFDAGPTDSDDAAQPDSSHDAPGAPPVEPSTTPSNEPSDPEGEDDGQDEIDPSAPPAPDSAAPDAPPEDDPLAGIAPFTYTVNGQSRTFDDIQVIPGKGAVISDAALSKLQQRFSERDTLFEKSQQQYKQYTDLERLTAWTTAGPDGKEQLLTGAAAMQARDLALEKANAVLNTIAQAFDNPEVFRSLVAVDKDGSIIPDPRAIEYLTTRAQLSAANAERSVQQRYQQAATPQQPHSQQAPDIQASAPALVQHFAQNLGVTVAPEDKGFLASMLPQFVRAATQEDVALSPTLTVGELVIDSKFGALLQQQAQLRTNTAKTVEQVSTISKENAAKLAAAAAGKTQVKSHVRNTPQRQAPQPDQRAQDAEDAFAMMQRASAGRF